MTFDLGLARGLLKLAREFRQPSDWWPGRNYRILNALTQAVEGEDKEEMAGLESLLKESDWLGLPSTQCVVLHVWQAMNLYRSRQFETALQACLEAENTLADDCAPDVRNVLADGFDRIGWEFGLEQRTAVPSEKAHLALTRAVALQPNAAHHHVGLGVMLYGLKQLEEAAAGIERGIKMGEDKAWAQNWLGNVYADLGRTDEALAAYQRAIELDPKYAVSHTGLGNVYRDLGEYEKAIAQYQERIRQSPKDADYGYNGLGITYQFMGQLEQAKAAYECAVELQPEDATYRASLASACRKLGLEGEYQKHCDMAREPMSKENEYSRACFASICGNVDEALALLKVALEKKQTSLAWARRDPDFDFIRGDPRFKALVGATDQV